MIKRFIFPTTTLLRAVCFFGLACLFPPGLSGLDDETKSLSGVGSKVQKSIVQIAITDQQGKEQSVGTGFATFKPGLIATNLHVIGEGRSFVLKDVNGNPLTVTEIVASDRFVDLAILKIKETNLEPLKLADYTQVKKGQPFVAIGHPQGLENSIVQGIISSKRNVDGRQMLQVAMPVEAGNSGGPLVNANSEVVGVVTLKSLATNNIGFAIGSDQIQKLMDKPNPIPLSQWLRIGVLRADTWKPLFGASWRQKGGRILAHSTGNGFGGRTLCIYQKPVPSVPFEMEVEVKLGEESGAAGLAFLVDEQERHYGFYPSNENIRFSRFEGSTPYEWTVLYDQPTESYKAGRWNRLKIRIEKEKMIAFVNGTKLVELKDQRIKGNKLGLAKFRDTRAEFRNFRIGKSLTQTVLPPEQKSRLFKNLVGELTNRKFENFLEESRTLPNRSRDLILDNVLELEKKIGRLKLLADSVHVEHVKQNFAKVLDHKSDQDIDLIQACLWIARLDDPDQEINGYVEYFESLAKQLLDKSKELKSGGKKIEALNHFLFEQNGFHGSRHEYYRPENSYISHVLEDREGIPITLSILYIEFAKRLGLSIDGIGLPGHFVVAQNRQGKTPQLIDVFNQGKLISLEDAKFLVASRSARGWDENYLSPVSKRQILTRVLLNLRAIAERKDDRTAILRYLELMFLLDPQDIEIKGTRALLLFQKGFQQKAIDELDQIIEKRPTGLDLRMLETIRKRLKTQMDRELGSKNSN